MTDLINPDLLERVIEAAAKRAVVEAPQKIMTTIRKKPLILELRVEEGGMTEPQKQEIEALTGDYRYDFITTSINDRIQIFGNVPKEEVQKNLDRIYQEDESFRVEIYQGTSEATMEELRRMYW